MSILQSLPVTGAALFDDLVAAGRSRGLSGCEVSRALFGCRTRIYQLRRTALVKPATLERAHAWLGLAPPPARPTGADLAREIDALLAARPDVIKARFSQAMNGHRNAIEQLRRVKFPLPTTVALVRGLIANPPLEALRQPALAARRSPGNLATPLPIDGRHGAERHQALVRQRVTRQAEARIAAGLAAAGAASAVVRFAQQALEVRHAETARLADPFEQAKVKLQRRGRVVYSMAVHGGRPDRFFVSGLGRDVTRARLIALAGQVAK